jgi:hypothetical protein
MKKGELEGRTCVSALGAHMVPLYKNTGLAAERQNGRTGATKKAGRWATLPVPSRKKLLQ